MHLQQKRRRGVLLTPQGLSKLQNAKQQVESSDNQRFTLELLSLRTNLDPHTLCKIFNHTARVDKKSLAKCFQAFNLVLQPDDYGFPTMPLRLVKPGIEVSPPILNPIPINVSAIHRILNEIETLSLDEQITLFNMMQSRASSCKGTTCRAPTLSTNRAP